MNANEIVKALRQCAQDENCLYPEVCPFGCDVDGCLHDMMKAAADLIESQAAKIAELNDFQNSQCAKLLEKLDEAERRERAAVEDLRFSRDCAVCKRDEDGDLFCIGIVFSVSDVEAGEEGG